METNELEQLRKMYTEIVAEMEADPARAAYHFGRLEIVTKQLFRMVDRNA
ncbi:hypothetical protein HEK616_40440 [Streptomyces nigrescens]|uniref:Uncharacterized protein n=1 Tax=Streptomyces nigrescens TaxID=1920 RepID=A0ABM7ZW11_STRNI|nr:hypothetical protein [Streptomyces nigrescens]BDM70557.1 hypothetical protein HEK616_40440 [Streptomyces nigrescens]